MNITVTATFYECELTHESQEFEVVMERLLVRVIVKFYPNPPITGMTEEEQKHFLCSWEPIQWTYNTQLADKDRATICAAVKETEAYKKLAEQCR